jgi:hypothetical protein
MQMVSGPSLATLMEDGGLEPRRALDLLEGVATALDAAHRAGIAHGDVNARNVLVGRDGQALLSDFGLSAAEPTVAGDLTDFEALLRECADVGVLRFAGSASELVGRARARLPAPRRRLGALPVAGLLAAVAIAAVLVVVLGGSEVAGVPEPERGAVALGSPLPGTDVSSVDCRGRSPSGGSQPCTLVQLELPGQQLVPTRPGVVRRWIVRGARGELALQVIRRGEDGWVSVARSHRELIPDEGVHVLPANLSVRAGDRIGVELGPGAAIGVRRGVPGATTARWFGPLFLEPRSIELGAGSGFDRELLLRAEYAPGAARRLPGQLDGRAARVAPDGRVLSSRTVDVRGALRRVAVVRLDDAIAVDVFAGDRRLARVPAGDADSAGRLVWFTAVDTTPILLWRNPDGRLVRHEYSVEPGTLTPRG